MYPLTDKERLLIELLRKLDPEDRGEVLGIAEAYLLKKEKVQFLLERFYIYLLKMTRNNSISGEQFKTSLLDYTYQSQHFKEVICQLIKMRNEVHGM